MTIVGLCRCLMGVLALSSLVLFSSAQAQTPAQQLAELATHLDAAVARLVAGDLAGAQAEYRVFDDGWFDVEDGIREQSRDSYRAIEDAMDEARLALGAQSLDAERARAALRQVRSASDAFISNQLPASQLSPASAETIPVIILGLLATLDRAQTRLDAGDTAGAAVDLDTFHREWTRVEDLVRTQSADVYRATETNMEHASALLSQPAPDAEAARALLAQIKADLAPFTAEPATGGAFGTTTGLIRPAA